MSLDQEIKQEYKKIKDLVGITSRYYTAYKGILSDSTKETLKETLHDFWVQHYEEVYSVLKEEITNYQNNNTEDKE